MSGTVTQVSRDLWRYETDGRFVDVYMDGVPFPFSLFAAHLFDSRQKLWWRPVTGKPFSHTDWYEFRLTADITKQLSPEDRKQVAQALTEHFAKGWLKTRLQVVPIEE